MQVLQQMLIFVIIMVVGAWARKKNILTPDNQGQITQLVLQVAYPAIILSGVTGDGPIWKAVPFFMLLVSSLSCWPS